MKIEFSDILGIIFGISGWAVVFYNSKVNKKYKSVEYLEKEITKISASKDTLKEIFTNLNEAFQVESFDDGVVRNLYQQAIKQYYPFYSALETMCGKVQYGIVSLDYFEKQIGGNLVVFAKTQVLYVRILKASAEKLNMPFGFGRNEDTFKNFYQLVASRMDEAECVKLNQERQQAGLPAYNKNTGQIEWG